MFAPELVDPPAELLTLPEVKTHLRVDGPYEDTYIQGLIAAAVGWMDGWQGVLGRCILTQTWATRHGVLVDMDLPFPDVQSAVVTYLDAAGATQTVAPGDYRVRTERGVGRLILADGFAAPTLQAGRDDAVTVTAVYGRAEAPHGLKAAALMLIAHWYQNREGAGGSVPPAVDALITPWRVGLV